MKISEIKCILSINIRGVFLDYFITKFTEFQRSINFDVITQKGCTVMCLLCNQKLLTGSNF